MAKYDKQFFIKDGIEKYEMYKKTLNDLIDERNSVTEDEFLDALATCIHLIRYYGDLLEILKE